MSEHSGLYFYEQRTPKNKAFLMICFCKKGSNPPKFCYQADIENRDNTLYSVRMHEERIFKEDLLQWLEMKKIQGKMCDSFENNMTIRRNNRAKSFKIPNFTSTEEVANKIEEIVKDNLLTI